MLNIQFNQRCNNLVWMFFWRTIINKLFWKEEKIHKRSAKTKTKKLQTLTTRDCKGPQTNTPKNVGSIKTWSAKIIMWTYYIVQAKYCNGDRTTWKLTLKDINTTSVWRNKQRSGSDEKMSAHSDFSPDPELLTPTESRQPRIAVFCLQNLICLHYYFCWSGLYKSYVLWHIRLRSYAVPCG